MESWIVNLLRESGLGLTGLVIVTVAWVVRGIINDKAASWGPLIFMAVCSKARREDLIRLEQSRRGQQADDQPEIEPSDADETDRDEGG